MTERKMFQMKKKTAALSKKEVTRTKAGMLRTQESYELDQVGKMLMDSIRKARAQTYYRQDSLDFWERRLWAWNDEAQSQNLETLDIDAETRVAVESVARAISNTDEPKQRDCKHHVTRNFMLACIRLVCDAIHGQRLGFGTRLDSILQYCAGAFYIRRKTEDERAVEWLIKDAYAQGWDPKGDEDYRPGWTPEHDAEDDDED